MKSTSDKLSILKYYPYDDYWSIVLSQKSRVEGHIHDLILKLISKKIGYRFRKFLGLYHHKALATVLSDS